jgi:tetratricopeptide (TPR) repeat protein
MDIGEIGRLEKRAQQLEKEDNWNREATDINQKLISSQNVRVLPKAYRRLAHCYFRHGFIHHAIATYKKLQDVDPDNKSVPHWIAGCEELLQYIPDNQRSERNFNFKFLEKNNNYTALIIYGKLLANRDMFEASTEAYIKAIALNPKNTVAYCGLGGTYTKMGNIQKAKAAYNDALKINRSDTAALKGVSKILSLEDKGQLARTLWRTRGLKRN